MKKPLNILRGVFMGVTVAVAVGLALLKLCDWCIQGQVLKPVGIRDSKGRSIGTGQLFPYTGIHIQANFNHEKGPMPGIWDGDYHVKTGAMGFFTDIDFDNPPLKAPNEYRIILIGGSGAQGWGGTTNEKMLYVQLEKRLNDLLSGSGTVVKVINMAMGGSITYQNYIALNLWGHKLNPDLILSYSGVNDHVVPCCHMRIPEVFGNFTTLAALVDICSGHRMYSPFSLWADKYFPNIVEATNLGMASEVAFNFPAVMKNAKEQYIQARGLQKMDTSTLHYKYAVPFWIHALKSIKRDFWGIPIMLAFQPAHPSEMKAWAQYYDRPDALDEDFYNQMFETARRELKDYINDKWYFINVHKIFEKDPKPFIAVHLKDEGHRVVAKILANELIEIVRSRPK